MTKERTKAEKEASDKLAEGINRLLDEIDGDAKELASKTPFKIGVL